MSSVASLRPWIVVYVVLGMLVHLCRLLLRPSPSRVLGADLVRERWRLSEL